MSKAAERETLIEDNRLLMRELNEARAEAAAQARALAGLVRAMQPFAEEYRRCAQHAPRSSVGWRTVTLREQDGDAILAALSAVAALGEAGESQHTRADAEAVARPS